MECLREPSVFYIRVGTRRYREDDMTGAVSMLTALLGLVQGTTIGPFIRIDLQGGFEGWKTFVYLEDSLVYRGTPSTDPLTGLAEGIELMGRSSIVDIRIRVPEVRVDSTVSMDITDGENLGLSLCGSDGGAVLLSVIHSTIPFGYD
jgi:hypothetical protein